MLAVKRVYEVLGTDDGARFSVERLWPRRDEKGKPDHGWVKKVAPSDGLRRWSEHDPIDSIILLGK